jgi:urease accessory protein
MNNWVTPARGEGADKSSDPLGLPEKTEQSKWKAELSLGLAQTKRGSVLNACRHQGPLYVQKAFYPEGRDLAHLYLLHPPGGMVSGDDLRINVTMAQAARALITTPGAGRVYKARADKTLQTQHIQLRLASGSSLEWLPLENIIYPGAHTQLNTDIHLAENSRFIGWEISSFGLKASQQPFNHGQLAQRLQIFQAGRLKVREALSLNPEQHHFMHSRAGLANRSVNALLIAGPFSGENKVDELLSALQTQCTELTKVKAANNPPPALAAVSLNGEFMQIRYLGDCSEQARLLFIRCWTLLRPALIQREACEPRIWAT